MKILFTLCGRAGSKGFKNKNLKYFLDIPLVYYSIAAIALYRTLADVKEDDIKVVLNTDSEDLINIVRKQSKVTIDLIRRDKDLGGDFVPKVAVIRNCVEQMEKRNNCIFDMVVDLDITSPLRTLDDIVNAVTRKKKRNDTDVVYSVTESRRNPYFNMVRSDGSYYCKALSSSYTARQQAPVFYDMNASIYVYSVNALKSKAVNTFFNDKCDAVLMKDTGILDIDSEEDFELMQVIAGYLYHKYSKYKDIYDMANLLWKCCDAQLVQERN